MQESSRLHARNFGLAISDVRSQPVCQLVQLPDLVCRARLVLDRGYLLEHFIENPLGVRRHGEEGSPRSVPNQTETLPERERTA